MKQKAKKRTKSRKKNNNIKKRHKFPQKHAKIGFGNLPIRLHNPITQRWRNKKNFYTQNAWKKKS